MIKCVIIDDEPLALDLIENYISRKADLTLVSRFTNPIEAFQSLSSDEVDLIFLDIQMPELSGIQFMKLHQGNIPIILTTAYNEYALKSYDFDVVDYLLKPIPFERFEKAIEKYKSRSTANQGGESKAIPSAQTSDYIFIKSSHKTKKVNLKDVLYLEGLGDYVAIITKEEKILTLEKMKNLEKSLGLDQFMRVHKSYIIPFSKIEFIERNRIKIGEKLIPIGATYQDAFWAAINAQK